MTVPLSMSLSLSLVTIGAVIHHQIPSSVIFPFEPIVAEVGHTGTISHETETLEIFSANASEHAMSHVQ